MQNLNGEVPIEEMYLILFQLFMQDTSGVVLDIMFHKFFTINSQF